MAMDVLWIIKEEHEKLRELMFDWKKTSENNLLAKKIHRIKDELLRVLDLESAYLIPELDGLFPTALKIAQTAQKSQELLKIQALSLDKYPAKTKHGTELMPVADKFCGTASEYLDYIDSMLMPKFREFMPTELREDLGQVYMDARQDALLEA